MSLARKLLAPTVAAGGFTPADLFTTEEGAWYDVSDLSSMFQNSNGTTAVTADGDPVGYLGDQTGNGHHLIQATAGTRPIYRTDGTYHWLECASQSLLTASSLSISGASGLFMGVTWQPQESLFLNPFNIDDANQRLTGDSRGTSNDFDVRTHALGAIPVDFSTHPDFVDYVQSGQAEVGGNVVARWDGVQVASEAAVDGAFSNGPIGMNEILGGNRENILFYGAVVIARTLSPAEISDTESFLADLAGVTL